MTRQMILHNKHCQDLGRILDKVKRPTRLGSLIRILDQVRRMHIRNRD